MEPSQAACVRAPMIATLPSCQSPSKNVQVFDTEVFEKAAITDVLRATAPRARAQPVAQ